jgi:uncharacterized Zn finger protein
MEEELVKIECPHCDTVTPTRLTPKNYRLIHCRECGSTFVVSLEARFTLHTYTLDHIREDYFD